MPENASVHGQFAELSFDTSEGNQLSCFKNDYFLKNLWSFHDAHNQVKCRLGWSKSQVSSQIDKLMAATKFSDYLGLNHHKKAKKNKTSHSFKVGYLASKFKYIPQYTLGCKMFAQGEKQLETTVIIKISTQPC